VDLVDRRGTKNDNQFFVGSTDDFFLQNKSTFDLIFIDASHHFENVKRDLDNSLKVLNQYGSIIVHDTDPIAEFFGTGATEDCYKIVDYIQSIPELTSVTLPVGDVGLTICKRRDDRRMLYLI
jgi:predicted O-methyltransferase YrrM